ncbi:MAG: hypothetical protein Unbinned5930contig1000_25 [Prokaryotic dsDNA virus sp.]|nr:MAG: hypothetical protein Unbinned5930contig1000_25 [Prokaryotic dsDNA virus sp.]|tara:strand:- start:3334 stop:3618 length:285 start_codon:yes stop_codon:yes gene_type:complete
MENKGLNLEQTKQILTDYNKVVKTIEGCKIPTIINPQENIKACHNMMVAFIDKWKDEDIVLLLDMMEVLEKEMFELKDYFISLNTELKTNQIRK